MNEVELEARIREAANAESWFEFEGLLAPIERNLFLEEPDARPENARRLVQVDERIGGDDSVERGAATTIVTDFFSELVSPGTLDLGQHHLSDLEKFGPRSRDVAGGRLRQWQHAVAGVYRKLPAAKADFAKGVLPDSLQRALEVSAPRTEGAIDARELLAKRTQPSLAPPNIAFVSRGGVSPGDLVFREMNIALLKFLGDFGHAGVYVGEAQDGADAGQEMVVEMQWSSSGGSCDVVTLAHFMAAAGPGKYWGAYSVDLDDPERRTVVRTALSFVGVAKYSFKDHKDPSAAKFRCDGLPEHCYESIRPTPARLLHRGGLFEDDKWNTMSPASLRNCLFRKI